MVEESEGFEDFPEDLDEELTRTPAAPPRKQQPPAPPQISPRGRPPQQPQQRSTVQAQAPASAPVQTPDKPRFIPFVLPARSGIFDNQTGQPFMEDPDKLDLIIGILTDHTNRLDRIEQGL